MRKTILKLAMIGILAVVLIGCGGSDTVTGSAAGDVAIYYDSGTWEESVRAAENMFRWMGLSVSRINANYVHEGGLDNFRLFCVPGGDMYNYSSRLGRSGADKIRAFVDNGGAYVGLCGGAYFAASRVYWQGRPLVMSPLGLFLGSAEGPVNNIVAYPGYGMCRVNLVHPSHPITELAGENMQMLYYWGPVLKPDSDSAVTILGRYDANDLAAIIALEFGSGRAFLIGTHPEIEEGSRRDSVDFADHLDDAGSDWYLMQAAVNWCLER